MNWDYSNWNIDYVIFFILFIIAFMWIFPLLAWFLFRFLITKGEKRDPDEYSPSVNDTIRRVEGQ